MLGLLAAVVGVLALPASAAAENNGSDCTYATNPADPDGGNVAVGVQLGEGGLSGNTGNTAVGACVNAPTPAGTFQGGAGEVGTGPNGTYLCLDGDNQNFGQAGGYACLSNYEDGATRDADCEADGPDQGAGGSTNSGGCFGVDGGPWVNLYNIDVDQDGTGDGVGVPTSVPTPACGNSSGNVWNDTSRDGCSNP